MKKKGLIIATIVMVLVLAVSLTTATYAWFSASATASINDITISTTAAEGLEIALNPSGENYYSGDITVTSGTWDGEDGFGAEITMVSGVGTMANAVTKVTSATERYPFIVTTADSFPTGATVYAEKTGGSAINTAAVDTTVYCTYTVGTYLVPLGYEDGTTNPTSYTVANVNENYLWLPIVLQTTSGGITNIYYKVSLTPSQGTIKANYMPGMAAASRITYSKDSTGSANVTDHTPFSAWSVTGTTMSRDVSGESKSWAQVTSQYQKYVYYGVLASGTEAIAQGTQYSLDIYSWIEGTDNECKNYGAGSGYTITIEFLYDKSSETAATPSNIATNTGWKTTNEVQNLD